LSSRDIAKLKNRFLDLGASENNSIQLSGQSIASGLPKKVTVKQKALHGYIETVLDAIVGVIRVVLEQSPPDIVSDIVKHGVVISGGSAQIKGLSKYLTKRLNVACVITDNPELSAIKGAHAALTHLEDYQRSLLS
jgi:rod shape-determining protein MreB